MADHAGVQFVTSTNPKFYIYVPVCLGEFDQMQYPSFFFCWFWVCYYYLAKHQHDLLIFTHHKITQS